MKKIIFTFAVLFAAFPFSFIHADEASSTPADASSTPPIVIATSTPPVIIATSTPPEGSSTPPVVVPTPDTVQITVRAGSTIAFSGIVSLADSSSSPIQIQPSHSSSTIAVGARTTLATMIALDASTTAFDITDLQYFSSFDSFFLNCINIPSASSTALCGSWQFTVDGVAPQVGADHVDLKNGDTVFLYFGSPRLTQLSTTTIETGGSFTATATSYDPATDVYAPTPGLTLGVTRNNPADSFNPIIVATSTADQNGQAVFTLNATGTYAVGIAEDFFFPSVALTVVGHAPADATSTPPSDGGTPPPPTGGGGGGISHTMLNIPNALAFVTAKQNADGSFASPLLTDWMAIAYAAASPAGTATTKLKEYLKTATPQMTSITDFERHAMALESLGINPYNGTPTDDITPIIHAYDGTQIGDPALDNDDIFAMFPLFNAGYSPRDPMMQKVATFILSRQKSDGSWDESPDMTAAALEAIGDFFGPSGLDQQKLGQAFGSASGYLASSEGSEASWGSIDSTSWVQMMINSVNAEDPAHANNWASSAGLFPNDAIARAQQSDGGVRLATDPVDTRTWSTSYAIVAASGKYWMGILQSFDKPRIAPVTVGGSDPYAHTDTATSSTATSTVDVATSTPPTASSTPLIVAPATTTVEITPAVVATSTTSTTTAPKVLKKKLVAPKKPVVKVPALPVEATSTPLNRDTQTAAAAASDSGLVHIWSTVVSFLARFF